MFAHSFISLGILPVNLEVRDASFHLIIVREERMERQFMNVERLTLKMSLWRCNGTKCISDGRELPVIYNSGIMKLHCLPWASDCNYKVLYDQASKFLQDCLLQGKTDLSKLCEFKKKIITNSSTGESILNDYSNLTVITTRSYISFLLKHRNQVFCSQNCFDSDCLRAKKALITLFNNW